MFYKIKKEKIYPAYIWEHNSKCDSYFFNDSERRRITLSCSKKVSAVFVEITSNGDLYCLSCLHLFKTKTRRESYKKVCKDKYFCGVVMPYKDI